MNLQPGPGQWNWGPLDTAVATAQAHCVPVTLVLAATPRWASSRPNERAYFAPGMAAPPRTGALWHSCVDQVVRRYRGRIQAYEVWNEPNLRGFFSGTPKQLADLTYIAKRAVKAVDPRAHIVGPAVVDRHRNAVPWLEAFFRAGGGAQVDAVSVHLYPESNRGPEDNPILGQTRALMRKYHIPRGVWDTEVNYKFPNRSLPPGLQAAFAARTYLWGSCASLGRRYWYAWDSQVREISVKLTQPNGVSRSLAGTAYQTMYHFMVGWNVLGCFHKSTNTWTVSLYRNGQRAAGVWNPSRTIRHPVPGWARKLIVIDGRTYPVRPGTWVTAGPTPILFRSY
jgi:hypothetical protein